MPYMFKPKHQKLILQCYPPKKLSVNGESMPNKSKLSYLVYYASTRRTKLEKVSSFLYKKTESDVSRGRLTNLKVTLYILMELVDKCSDDLGMFAMSVAQILEMVLLLRDLSTCQLALKLYTKFCEKLAPIEWQTFSSNHILLKKFIHVSGILLNFGWPIQEKPQKGCRSRQDDSTYNSAFRDDWLRISLLTAGCIAEYVSTPFSIMKSANLVEKSIHLILKTFDERTSFMEALSRTLSNTSAISSLEGEKKQNADSRDEATQQDISSGSGEDGEGAMNLENLALISLKTFFSTSSKRQVDTSTKAIISYALKYGADVQWINKLMILCAKKTHIELRYRIISTMMVQLNSSVGTRAFRMFLCDLISNILSSEDVNLVGLPVRDVLNGMLTNQKNLVCEKSLKDTGKNHNDSSSDTVESAVPAVPRATEMSENPSQNTKISLATRKELQEAFLDVISSLGKHIYYNTQINDMVMEILSYYYNFVKSVSDSEVTVTEEEFVSTTRLMICDVESIHDTCGDDSYLKYKRVPYRLNMMNHLLYTLGLLQNIDTSILPRKTSEQVQQAWMHVLENFCQSEIDGDHPSNPNVDLCITNNLENPICLYLDLIPRMAEVSIENSQFMLQVWETTEAMFDHLKINFFINFLKFSGSWLGKEPGTFEYNYALMILYRGGSVIDCEPLTQYVAPFLDELQRSGKLQGFFSYVNTEDVARGSLPSVINKAELVKIYRECPQIFRWLAFTGITSTSYANSETPTVSQSPPSRGPLTKALTDASLRLASTYSTTSLLPALSPPGTRSRDGSILDISTISPSIAQSFSSVRTRTSFRDLLSITSGMNPPGTFNNSDITSLNSVPASATTADVVSHTSAPSVVPAPAPTTNTTNTLSDYNLDLNSDNGNCITINGTDANNAVVNAEHTAHGSEMKSSSNKLQKPVSSNTVTLRHLPRKKSGLAFCISNLNLSDSDDDSSIKANTVSNDDVENNTKESVTFGDH